MGWGADIARAGLDIAWGAGADIGRGADTAQRGGTDIAQGARDIAWWAGADIARGAGADIGRGGGADIGWGGGTHIGRGVVGVRHTAMRQVAIGWGACGGVAGTGGEGVAGG